MRCINSIMAGVGLFNDIETAAGAFADELAGSDTLAVAAFLGAADADRLLAACLPLAATGAGAGAGAGFFVRSRRVRVRVSS